MATPESQVSSSPNVAASELVSPRPSVSPAESPKTSPVLSLTPGWERIKIQTELGAPLTRVVWTGTRFLTVDGTLLDSSDGRTWRQQPQLPGGAYISQVAAGPAGVLAIGSLNVEGVITIWHSTDGLDWRAAPDAVALHGKDGAFITMAAVLAAGNGWLAVGGENLSCTPGACRLVRAVVWTSPDGVRWTRRPDTAAMQHAEMTGLVRTPTGYVAVGDTAVNPSNIDSAIRPAVWTSPDGRIWTRSEGLPEVTAATDADVMLDSVTAAESRVVAVGHVSSQADGSAGAFAWWSDGGDWSSIEIGRFSPSQGARVVAVPGGLLAMFGLGSDATCSSEVWSSADGSSWSCMGNDPAFAGSAVSDAAVGAGIEVLVGSGTDGAVVWTGTPR